MKTVSFDQFRTRFGFDPEEGEFKLDGNINVFKATDNVLHRTVALKIVQDEAEMRRYPSLADMAKLFKLEHGHLVSYFDFLRVEKSKDLPAFDVLVMDYISGGDFSSLKGTFITEQNRSRVVEGIIGALGVLHQKGLFHGNLKAGNILFQDIGHLHVRLSDYGFVSIQEYQKTGSQFKNDSIKYLAPEQIDPKNFGRRSKIDKNVDFWALGMLVYELYTGHYAFGDITDSTSDLLTKILHADLPADIDQLPPNYAELVKACLVRSAADRPKDVVSLRRILDGERVWRDGKLKKIPRTQKKASIQATPPPPAEVKCGTCGKLNRPTTTVCAHCGSAISGPAFLKNFRRPGAYGFWSMLLMTALFVPLGFVYYQFYQFCNHHSGTCDLLKWLRYQAVNFDLDKTSMTGAELEFERDEVQAAAILFGTIVALGILITGLFFMLWFSRVNSNLAALGANGRRYHWTMMLLPFLMTSTALGVMSKAPLIGLGIMILALVLPLLMFQEVWKGSNPNYLGGGTDWRRSKGSFMIFSWWISSLLLPVLIVIPFLPTPFQFITYEAWFILGVSLIAIYWLLSMLLVVRINLRQNSKFKAWARQGGE